MPPTLQLDELADLDSAVIVEFDPAMDRNRRERFEDLGLLRDTRVVRERAAPWGDPIVFRVRGTALALRREEARLLRARRLPEP